MQQLDLRKFCLVAVMCSLCVAALPSVAQIEHITVQNPKTGVYRALAQLMFQSFKKGDVDTAATLGRVLDRTWDQIEENGDHGLNKTNPKVFGDIDEAMDAFIKPIIHYDQETPEPASVESAYNAYIAKLKEAD